MVALPNPVDHITAAIDAAYERKPSEKRRGYLGASIIGEECERKLWYGFRWSHEPEQFDGRKLRLFETGHIEEARLLNYLRLAGCEVHEVDPATGEQFAVRAVGGHVGGHEDGEATGVPGAPMAEHVIECKTHNERSFKDLVKNGVEKSKPMHYAQMQLYMHLRGKPRGLYLAKNKNTDDLHCERVAYDPAYALRLMAKAERIVTAETAPPRLHEDVTSKAAFACNWCAARNVCHEGAFAPRSCRSCLHSTPVMSGDAGGWHCSFHDRALSVDEQRVGCSDHLYLPSLVNGEQIDATETPASVTYRLPNGDTWVDGGKV